MLLLVLGFSIKSQAAFRIGINKTIQQETKCEYPSQAELAVNVEYLFANNYSLYLNPRLSSEPVLIEVCSRYYFAADKGTFIDVSFINRTEKDIRKYIDLTVGGGYLVEINDFMFLDFKTGYTITPRDQDNYASLSLGIKFAVVNYDKQKLDNKITEPTKRMRILTLKYPNWQEKTIMMIVQEKIAINLNTTQVLESWGEPNKITIKEKGKYQKWIYEFKDKSEVVTKSYTLYFVNKKLKKWQIN